MIKKTSLIFVLFGCIFIPSKLKSVSSNFIKIEYSFNISLPSKKIFFEKEI